MQEPPGTTTPAAFDQASLADRVRLAAAARPDRPALIWRDQTISWAELEARVDRVSRALGAAVPAPAGGVPPRIAIALPNSPDFAVAFFATLRAGLIAVPVNPAFTARELQHVLADSGSAVLLCSEQVRDAVAAVRDSLPALSAVHTDLPVDPEAAPRPLAWTGDDLAVLLYTSGTEGHPKGAMLSHRALLANHEQIGRIEPSVVGPADTLLLALPLFHAYGLNSGLGAVAYHGACGVLVDTFDPRDALAVIARHQVTAVVGVPAMFVGWSLLAEGSMAGRATASAAEDVGAAMASVRVAVCGAAPLDPATAARFTAATGRRVFMGYGLTETAPVLTSTLVSPVAKSGSIGQAIPGVEVRLVGPDGATLWPDASAEDGDDDDLDLEYASPGTDPGEIVVRGENLFSGYWPDGRDGPDEDGWWATGDIAYADADGDLFLVDRLGELILVNGFNVYPHEVELVLESHPGVAESAVVGIPHPYTGQAIKAYVVRAPGSTVTVEEVLEHCGRNLARFKWPAAVEFVTTLPHSAIGKVRKTLLRAESGSA